METYRLLPEHAGDWARFEDFRNRIAAFTSRYLTETPVDAVLRDITQRWINMPIATGYWIVYDGAEPRAHLCAYVNERWGLPFIQFYEIAAEGAVVLDVLAGVATEIRRWVETLNVIYEKTGSPLRIRHGESSSWIEPKLYERMFRGTGFAPTAQRTVYRWNLTDERRDLKAVG